MNSSDKLLTMKLNSIVPRVNRVNEGSADLVICLDSGSMQNGANLSPSLTKLLDKITQNIEMDSARRKLDLDEKSIQLSILEEEKNYKKELNKFDLMQRSLIFKKKTADFEYTNKLRDLLLDALSCGDLQKASYLNQCINNNQTDMLNSYFVSNLNTNSHQHHGSSALHFMNQPNGSANALLSNENNNNNNINNNMLSNNLSDEESLNDDAASQNTNNGMIGDLGDVMNTMNNNNINEDEIVDGVDIVDCEANDLEPKIINYNKFSLGPSSPMFRLSLANKNIRHLICSSSKLEDYSTSSALNILYKGKCQDSHQDICHRKETHTHYLIDCTNCRRHISLYFQTAKYGLKFYKTYQIKSQAELDKIIRTFRMRNIRE